MEFRFGFIGTGNMGGAMAQAVAKALEPSQLFLANRTHEKAAALASKLGATAVSVEAAATCDIIFLGVKPQMMQELLMHISPILAQRKQPFALVSMAAGLTTTRIREMAGGDYPVIRIMPNTPVAVGSGVILYDYTDNVSKEILDAFCFSMRYAGLVDHLPEKLIDAGTSVAGCGPAFAFYFIEALTQGGVACGLPEEKAMQYAKQMLLGSAMLALQAKDHPSKLRQAVCSPAGSTIEGVHKLEESGFADGVTQAVIASYKRNAELGK